MRERMGSLGVVDGFLRESVVARFRWAAGGDPNAVTLAEGSWNFAVSWRAALSEYGQRVDRRAAALISLLCGAVSSGNRSAVRWPRTLRRSEPLSGAPRLLHRWGGLARRRPAVRPTTLARPDFRTTAPPLDEVRFGHVQLIPTQQPDALQEHGQVVQ